MWKERNFKGMDRNTRTIGCCYVQFVKIFRCEMNCFERIASEGDEGGPEIFQATMEKIKK